MKINGHKITAQSFAYDECHKIYLCESEEQKNEAKSTGYKIYEISHLKEIFNTSCPLRFINYWDLEKEEVIPQCYEKML